MKPYEEIDFPNGFLRWIREDGMYSCTLTAEQMIKIKALHEAPRTWVGLTDKDWNRSKHNYDFQKGADWAESILKEKNT